ncbi:MAG: DoxX family protein [Candidatus Margulisiibacteriota bacterium]
MIRHLLAKTFHLISAQRSYWLLLIRVTLGIIFIQTGFGKLTHLDATTDFFQSIGVPFPFYNAILASSTELIGGACLILGFFTRMVVLPLSFTMVVAIFTALRGDIHSLSDFVRLQEWDYILMFLLLFFTGAGKFSLDNILAKWFNLYPDDYKV